MTRRPTIRALAVLVVGIAALAVSPVPAWAEGVPLPLADPLVVDAPATVTAGSEALVFVSGVPAGDAVRLAVVGALGSTVLEADAGPIGEAAFVLPDALVETAGALTLLAASGSVRGEGEIVVESGPVASPVETVVGARSIVADGADVAMAVSIPVDAYGNAVGAGTPVRFTRTTPAGGTEVVETRTEALLAWADLPSGTVAGSGSVWATVGAEGATGQATTLLEVPGRPLRFTLAVAASTEVGSAGGAGLEPAEAPGALGGRADARSVTPLETSVLADAFGNVVEDGTSVQLRWTGPDGAGTATAVTSGGVARLLLPAPQNPGVRTVTASSRGVAGAPLALDFASVVAEVPVTAVREGDTLSVVLGPVLDREGHYLADGTPFRLAFPGTGLPDRTGRLYAGTAQLDLALPPELGDAAVAVRARVLGAAGETRSTSTPSAGTPSAGTPSTSTEGSR